MTINDVLDTFADQGIELNINLLDDETVVLEGSETGLTFLGQLLLKMSDELDTDSLHIGPNTAGNHFFSDKSQLGIYIHKVRAEGKTRK